MGSAWCISLRRFRNRFWRLTVRMCEGENNHPQKHSIRTSFLQWAPKLAGFRLSDNLLGFLASDSLDHCRARWQELLSLLKLGARFYLRSSVKWVTTPHDASLSSRIQGNEQCCRKKKSLKLTPSLRPNIGRTRPVSCEMDTQETC